MQIVNAANRSRKSFADNVRPQIIRSENVQSKCINSEIHDSRELRGENDTDESGTARCRWPRLGGTGERANVSVRAVHAARPPSIVHHSLSNSRFFISARSPAHVGLRIITESSVVYSIIPSGPRTRSSPSRPPLFMRPTRASGKTKTKEKTRTQRTKCHQKCANASGKSLTSQ